MTEQNRTHANNSHSVMEPGEAEGEVNPAETPEEMVDPGRTPGQAEGEREFGTDYEYQRDNVFANGTNGHSQELMHTLQQQFDRFWQQVEINLRDFAESAGERSAGQGFQNLNKKELGRLASMVGGGALALYGLRRSLGSLTVAGIGAGLFYWGLTGESPLPAKKREGYMDQDTAISEIHRREGSPRVNMAASPRTASRSLIVKAEVADVYAAWADFENFPRFMKHIKAVSKTGEDTSHWVMEGPFDTRLEWDAKTTRMEENKRIGWSSFRGDIKTSGQVTFTALPEGETEITVTLQYVPPAGLAGEVMAELFGHPDRKLLEDLRHFKAFIEKG